MDGQATTDNILSEQSHAALLSSLLNGSESLSQNPDAKNLLSQLLTGGQGSPGNLQQVISAVGSLTTTQQQPSQKQLPTLKPTNNNNSSSPAPALPQTVTTPTQPTPTAGRKRGRPPTVDQDDSLKKRRGSGYSAGRGGGGEKQNKGLRHFSQLVCEKVREKGVTTYNEVADELVRELDEQEQKAGSEMQIDQKNIRRRVYDALNVLMAMNIISKEKKEIKWIGLPTNSVQECEHIQAELVQHEERIARKKAELHELVLQILTIKNLMKRNKERAEAGNPPTPNSAIGLPFILVNTNKDTIIDCSISSDKTEYIFNFSNTFELHQDVDVLKKMGLDCGLHSGSCTAESLALAKSLLPKMLEPVLDEMAEMSALSTTITPQSPLEQNSLGQAPSSPPLTPLPISSSGSSVQTPLLNDANNGGPSYSSSPRLAANMLAASSPSQLAAALSTLQQLQQTASTASVLASPSTSGDSSSSSSMSSHLPPPGVSINVAPPTNTATIPGSTVIARPLTFASPKQTTVPISPLLKTSHPLSGVAGTHGRSPGAKVVTVQPLPSNATSVADIIASLQQNVSNLLKQQGGVSGGSGATPMNTTTQQLTSLLSNLQPSQSLAMAAQQLPSQKKVMGNSNNNSNNTDVNGEQFSSYVTNNSTGVAINSTGSFLMHTAVNDTTTS